MTVERQREIVIEFEKVQLIRKRAKTTLAFCTRCGGEADFVELKAAAALFDTSDGDLEAFVASNPVHTEADIDICIPSLLAVMHERNNGGKGKLIGTSIPPAAAGGDSPAAKRQSDFSRGFSTHGRMK